MFSREYICTVNVKKNRTLYSKLFWLKFCFFTQLSLKMLSGIANSVDPDQTAPLEQSDRDLGLHCLHMPFCHTLFEIL